MTVDIQWEEHDVPVIHYTFKGWWTAHELEIALTRAFEWLTRTSQKVYGIMDFRGTLWVPPNILPLLIHTLNTIPDNAGELVMIGMPAAMLQAVSLLRSNYGRPLTWAAESLQDAYLKIESLRGQSTFADVARTPGKFVSSLARLSSEETIQLMTFAPTGQPHVSTVWFLVPEMHPFESHLYVLTPADSRKVAHVQRNPRIRILNRLGNTITRGQAAIIPVSQHPGLAVQWSAKYGLQGFGVHLLMRLQHPGHGLVFLEITSDD
ncbi:MAG TPA: pyridoxamine 5'-phosphate oxidase family protein [Phototrophicaceae bacterium]|jgi:hypothetical protein|nr:pyridoxamine 5'-phosphate oxidase family protein [Phototrophicaceae bacterium]